MAFGDFIGGIGHALHLPEMGISEALGGRKNMTVYPSATSSPVGSPGYAPSLTPGTPEYNALHSTLGQDDDTNPNPLPGRTLGAMTTAPTNPNGSVAPVAPPKPDKSADIATQNAALAALDSQRTGGLQKVTDALNNLFGKYDTESGSAERNFTDQSTTNRSNLQKNVQASMVNAAQGRQGLFGTLAALGALSGSGIDLANLAVQRGANADISGAQDTFSGNQTGLQTSIDQFRDADKARRKDAQEAANNARTNVENQIFTNRQKLYANLADDYAAEEDVANQKKYADLVAGLFPDIARTSIPSSANIAYSQAAYTPSALSRYIGGATSPQVSTTPAQGTTLPGLIVSPFDRRRDQATA